MFTGTLECIALPNLDRSDEHQAEMTVQLLGVIQDFLIDFFRVVSSRKAQSGLARCLWILW